MDQAAKYVESATGTKGLIIDIRNYPSEFMVFALGSLLVDHKTDFVGSRTEILSIRAPFIGGHHCHWSQSNRIIRARS